MGESKFKFRQKLLGRLVNELQIVDIVP